MHRSCALLPSWKASGWTGAVCAAALNLCAILEFRGPRQAAIVHPVPDLLVTNLCFGGNDMRNCFVTLSHQARLVCLDWHEPGLRLHHADACPPASSPDRPLAGTAE